MSKHFAEKSEKARFETFFDAILAILITILVLEFRVPDNAYSSDDEIKTFIRHLVPAVFSYVISFATIVSLWLNHHDLCRLIKSVDLRFIILNFVFILFVSSLPFTTALAGRNHESSYAVALVATNYFLMNIGFASIWGYVVTKRIIPEETTRSKAFKKYVTIAKIGSVLLLMSIPLAYVSTYISFALFIVVLFLHIGKEFFYNVDQ
ncbi:MAG TPA: TMEM175 family protein [Chitinophagaceae bacterium]|nr:TMEM175 family protein [Chitinophagaceae bacterium]